MMMLAILVWLKTVQLLQNGLQPHSEVAPLFSMRTESLASSQSCHSVDADAWCKQALIIVRPLASCPKEKEGRTLLEQSRCWILCKQNSPVLKPPGKEISSLLHDFSQWNFRTHQKKPIALSLHVCVHRILDCEYICGVFFVLFF